MKFTVAIKADRKVDEKIQIIVNTTQLLKAYFQNRNYGSEVEEVVIMCICIDAPQSSLFEINRPKYVGYAKKKNRFTGEDIEIVKSFFFDMKFEKPEYDSFVSGSEKDSQAILSRKIIDSLDSLLLLPKKIRDFDKEKFESDLIAFFEESGLI